MAIQQQEGKRQPPLFRATSPCSLPIKLQLPFLVWRAMMIGYAVLALEVYLE